MAILGAFELRFPALRPLGVRRILPRAPCRPANPQVRHPCCCSSPCAVLGGFVSASLPLRRVSAFPTFEGVETLEKRSLGDAGRDDSGRDGDLGGSYRVPVAGACGIPARGPVARRSRPDEAV